jgi:hypothetical protein
MRRRWKHRLRLRVMQWIGVLDGATRVFHPLTRLSLTSNFMRFLGTGHSPNHTVTIPSRSSGAQRHYIHSPTSLGLALSQLFTPARPTAGPVRLESLLWISLS